MFYVKVMITVILNNNSTFLFEKEHRVERRFKAKSLLGKNYTSVRGITCSALARHGKVMGSRLGRGTMAVG